MILVRFPGHGKTSKDIHGLGNLLPDKPDAPRGDFDTCEYRRRIQEARAKDMESLLEEVSKLLGAYASAIEAKTMRKLKIL
jgi:hypothetical protein